jgi:hypothetical protein
VLAASLSHQGYQLGWVPHVVEYPAGKDQVKVRAVSPQVLKEIPTKEADSAEVEQLLDDQALQVGTRIGLDRDNLPRAEPLKHKRVSAFERAQLQHRPAFDPPNLLHKPRNAGIVEETSAAGLEVG